MIDGVVKLLVSGNWYFHWLSFCDDLVPLCLRFSCTSWLCCCAALLYFNKSEGLIDV